MPASPRGIRWVVGCLVAIGVTTSVARTVYLPDLILRVEPARAQALDALGLPEPRRAERTLVAERFDARFAAHPGKTYVHVIVGALFVLLAPLQFSTRLRTSRPAVHRWTGRALVTGGVAMAFAGMYFGLVVPIAGNAERIVIALAGGLFLFSLATAYFAIRAGNVERHRAWMVRAFAIAIGIATVRIMGAVFDLTLSPAGVPVETVFVLALWSGWVVTLAGAELWLHRDRRDSAVDAPDQRVISAWPSNASSAVRSK